VGIVLTKRQIRRDEQVLGYDLGHGVEVCEADQDDVTLFEEGKTVQLPSLQQARSAGIVFEEEQHHRLHSFSPFCHGANGECWEIDLYRPLHTNTNDHDGY
jgi:hypothetical protein